MVEWHHQLNGHEFEQAVGDSEGQGSLVCCSPWGCEELDTTEQLNNNNWAGGSIYFSVSTLPLDPWKLGVHKQGIPSRGKGHAKALKRE